MLAATVVTLSIGTLGFHLIADYPLFDALYMALITMTTVGYSEIRELSQAGRIFNVFYILLSVSVPAMAATTARKRLMYMVMARRGPFWPAAASCRPAGPGWRSIRAPSPPPG